MNMPRPSVSALFILTTWMMIVPGAGYEVCGAGGRHHNPCVCNQPSQNSGGYRVEGRDLIGPDGRPIRVPCVDPNCKYGGTGVHSCGRGWASPTQESSAEAAAANQQKQQERIRQSQATSDAFKNARDQLWEQQQKANQQIDWDKGVREREDRLNATSKKVDASLDQLSRAQNVLTWKQKIKEKENLIAKTKATIARLEEAKKTIQSSQRDVENANREATYYAWAAQAVGAIEIIDGMGVMISAVLPPQYTALREALKKGRSIGKGIGAAGGAPIAMANSLQQGDNSGAVVDALKGVTAAVGAATTSKYASQQEKDFTDNLGRITDGAEMLDASDKGKTDLAEYKKAKFLVNEMGPVGKRISEGLDGAEQIYSGSVKVSEMSDEEVKILTRAVAQKANFSEIMTRVDNRLTLERNTLAALETELYRLKEDGPHSGRLNAY